MTATPEIHLTFRKTPRNRKGEFNSLFTVTDATGKDLCSARTPFCSAARVLLQQGHDPASTIFMKREGETSSSLKGTLGVVAKLTVRENDSAGPIFVAYNDEKLVQLRTAKASI
jgi:hypothetical protein